MDKLHVVITFKDDSTVEYENIIDVGVVNNFLIVNGEDKDMTMYSTDLVSMVQSERMNKSLEDTENTQ